MTMLLLIVLKFQLQLMWFCQLNDCSLRTPACVGATQLQPGTVPDHADRQRKLSAAGFVAGGATEYGKGPVLGTMRSWTVLLLALSVSLVAAAAVQRDYQPCQLSDCRLVVGTAANCSQKEIKINQAYPISPSPTMIPSSHLFSLFHEPTGAGCLSLTLDFRIYGQDQYDLQLRVGHVAGRLFYDVMIWQFGTTEMKPGCFQRTFNTKCEVDGNERFRLTVVDSVSFTLEDLSPLVPQGTQMLFRSREGRENNRGCSRDHNRHFWATLDRFKACLVSHRPKKKGESNHESVPEVDQQVFAYKVTHGAILIVLLFLVLSYHMVYKFIDTSVDSAEEVEKELKLAANEHFEVPALAFETILCTEIGPLKK
ncbi:hypothetical protein pipiens_011002 [Culex pipiens pipiens]|uniref:Uncharacterized protein n=1 Tax=Culex pipiens pipiens TaxID=38569 RepID=A0ABD1D806_CULPP